MTNFGKSPPRTRLEPPTPLESARWELPAPLERSFLWGLPWGVFLEFPKKGKIVFGPQDAEPCLPMYWAGWEFRGLGFKASLEGGGGGGVGV